MINEARQIIVEWAKRRCVLLTQPTIDELAEDIDQYIEAKIIEHQPNTEDKIVS